MSKDEQNKYIHRAVMGHWNTDCACPQKCDCQDFANGLVSNSCPEHNERPDVNGCPIHDAETFDEEIKDYADSLDAIRLAESTVIELVGWKKYYLAVTSQIGDRTKTTNLAYEHYLAIRATAAQRAAAIIAAHQEFMEDE